MDIHALLKKMTVNEKVYQLLQLNADLIAGKKAFYITGPDSEREFNKEYISETGTTLNSIGAKKMIEIQQKHLSNNNNKIPLIFMLDVIHGYRTLYPINLGLSSSFDTKLAHDCAQMAAKEASVDGVHLTFAPMADLVRDARWGRVMESNGEDPYLNCEMVKATVEGYQGDMGKYNVVSCVKHFAAYGAAESGKDYNSVDMSERTLREYYLPAYKAALDAGAKLVMTSFNIIDGIPATANKWLVDGILRKEWGFDGPVISDYAAVNEMIAHGYVESEKDAAYTSMQAGIDIEMMSSAYPKYLAELIDEGAISMEQLDKAVLRILKLKEELGLFDNPYRSTNVEEAEKILLCKEHRELAKYAAKESAVLLKNEGVLPFSENVASVAVIGPLANTGEIFGNWHCDGRAEDTVTVFDGIKSIVGDKAKYAIGCSIDRDSSDLSQIDEAVNLASQSEVVVLCLGEHQFDSGESKSKANLDLSPAQYKLLEEILKVNKNVAVLLFTGRPLTIERLDKTAPAILNMWMPGTEGGNAAAELVFGRHVPSGKLTMSFPRAVGQCPIYYNHYNTGRPKPHDNDYCAFTSCYLDTPNSPLYPFGYGLSYTKFEYSDCRIDKTQIKSGEVITASVKVKNVGNYTGKETVQLYVRDLFGSTVRPVKELKGFEKIELAPGEEKTVTFEINEDKLAFYGADKQRKAEKGRFQVFIAPNSNCDAFAEFELA